jgi:hypothetical protein
MKPPSCPRMCCGAAKVSEVKEGEEIVVEEKSPAKSEILDQFRVSPRIFLFQPLPNSSSLATGHRNHKSQIDGLVRIDLRWNPSRDLASCLFPIQTLIDCRTHALAWQVGSNPVSCDSALVRFPMRQLTDLCLLTPSSIRTPSWFKVVSRTFRSTIKSEAAMSPPHSRRRFCSRRRSLPFGHSIHRRSPESASPDGT